MFKLKSCEKLDLMLSSKPLLSSHIPTSLARPSLPPSLLLLFALLVVHPLDLGPVGPDAPAEHRTRPQPLLCRRAVVAAAVVVGVGVGGRGAAL